MSVWVGFAKAQGVAKKVALVKTLVEADDISQAIIAGNPPGILATIDELAKVDFAICQVLSSVGGFSGSGYKQPSARVINYSGNRFLFVLETVVSGIGVTSLGQAAFSGDNMSGVIKVQAFILGEPKNPAVVN